MERRPMCERCCRPMRTCYCAGLPDVPARLDKIKIVVLQHSKERNQAFNSVRMLPHCIDNVEIVYGKRFKPMELVNPVCLYPAHGATEIPPDGTQTILVLDGTWQYTKSIYKKHNWISEIPAWRLECHEDSIYAPLRRPPKEGLVSTADAILRVLEFFHEAEAANTVRTALNHSVEIELKIKEEESREKSNIL